MCTVAGSCTWLLPTIVGMPSSFTHTKVRLAVTAVLLIACVVASKSDVGARRPATCHYATANKLPPDARFIDRWCFMAKDAVCTVIDKYDLPSRGRQLELVSTQPLYNAVLSKGLLYALSKYPSRPPLLLHHRCAQNASLPRFCILPASLFAKRTDIAFSGVVYDF